MRIVLSLRSDAGVADRLENCRQVAQNFRVREADDTLARCFEQRSPRGVILFLLGLSVRIPIDLDA